MEAMSKFKVGDVVKVIASNEVLRRHRCTQEIKSGENYTVTEMFDNDCKLNNFLYGCVEPGMIEIAKPKWTIYNNTLPWSDLSDKQKGKMLLGDHEGIKFTIDNVAFIRVGFVGENSVYKAQYIEPVKPEPTMAELFMADLSECNTGLLKHIPEPMIAKGWTKSCK
jgi:hypothetical protein